MKQKLFLSLLCLISIFSLQAQVVPTSGIVYVKKGGAGNGNGSSWENAAGDLADVLKDAYENPGLGITEIWVAEGIYYPKYIPETDATDTTDRDQTFLLVSGVNLYGGFPANATTSNNSDKDNIAHRNWKKWKTTLSGDIGESGYNSDNTYHVVTAVSLTSTIELNGFVIIDGNANGSNSISHNLASIDRANGGGISFFNTSSYSLYIKNTIITNNYCDNKGGGVYASLFANPYFVNTLINSNTAGSSGGGVYIDGQKQSRSAVSASKPTFVNVTIADNLVSTGYEGGGITSFNRGSYLYNSIIWGNAVSGSDRTSENSGYAGVSGIPSSSIIQGKAGMNTDPKFISFGTNIYHLQAGSPAINGGANSYYETAVGGSMLPDERDLSSIPRIIDTDIDMGAFEFNPDDCPLEPAPDANGIMYVDHTKNGNGESWECALAEVSDALLAAKRLNDDSCCDLAVKEIWVAKGTYYPLYGVYGESSPGRATTFSVLTPIKIYGGFHGANDGEPGETSVDDRIDYEYVHVTNKTILSGDIYRTPSDPTDNAYNIVYIYVGIDQGNTLMDGFTISGGYDTKDFMSKGAGIYLIEYGEDSSVTINNNIIENNRAGLYGGGIYAETNSLVSITNNEILNNIVVPKINDEYGEVAGGGIYSYALDGGTILIEHNTIDGNKLEGASAYGAGIYSRAEYGTTEEKLNKIAINYNRIENNTIENADSFSAKAHGGGIFIQNSLAPENKSGSVFVSYNHINKNELIRTFDYGSIMSGGGICIWSVPGPLPNSLNPKSSSDVDIDAVSGINVVNNLIAGNKVSGYAAFASGIYAGIMFSMFETNAKISVVNNTITQNTAIGVVDQPIEINAMAGVVLGSPNEMNGPFVADNNIIWGNTYSYKGETEYGSKDLYVFVGNDQTASVRNNYMGDFVNGNPGPVSESNNKIGTGDPLFVDTSDADVSKNDYRLQNASGAIDMGNNALYTAAGGHITLSNMDKDLGNIDRLYGIVIDAGAYEAEACPPIAVWLGVTSDWYTPSNWYPARIPQSCTDVYIPGVKVISTQSDYLFPSLTSTPVAGVEENSCDRIFFMPGAQLGRPDLLTYTEAHVELDYGKGSLAAQTTLEYDDLVALTKEGVTSADRIAFGATYSGVTLDRNRWNMLAAPLNQLTTGDYAFGGFPYTYIRKFDPAASEDTNFIHGRWAAYSNETTLVFEAGQGFGHYVYGTDQGLFGMDSDASWATVDKTGVTAPQPQRIKYDGSGEEAGTYGLARANGIVHFPYHEDKFLSSTHRNHSFAGGESTFHNFWQYPPSYPSFLGFTGNKYNVDRTDAYRFVAEQTDGTMDFTYNPGTIASPGATEFILLGNPYMSALDFAAFYSKNSSLIVNGYQVYDGNTYLNQTDLGAKIAPMQSFLVQLLPAYAGEALDFNFEGTMAVTDENIFLKASAGTTPNVLTITAVNPAGAIKTRICQSDDASDKLCHMDMAKVIDYPVVSEQPEVYTLAQSENGSNHALTINTVSGNNLTLPVGIITTYEGKMTLTLSGMDAYNAQISFIDLAKNSRHNITGRQSFEYSFTHLPILNEDGEAQATEDRFVVQFAPCEATGMNDVAKHSTRAYVHGSDVVISSSDKINAVQVYDIQGRTLYDNRQIDAYTYSTEGNTLSNRGVYIVRITTANGLNEIKVVK